MGSIISDWTPKNSIEIIISIIKYFISNYFIIILFLASDWWRASRTQEFCLAYHGSILCLCSTPKTHILSISSPWLCDSRAVHWCTESHNCSTNAHAQGSISNKIFTLNPFPLWLNKQGSWVGYFHLISEALNLSLGSP